MSQFSNGKRWKMGLKFIKMGEKKSALRSWYLFLCTNDVHVVLDLVLLKWLVSSTTGRAFESYLAAWWVLPRIWLWTSESSLVKWEVTWHTEQVLSNFYNWKKMLLFWIVLTLTGCSAGVRPGSGASVLIAGVVRQPRVLCSGTRCLAFRPPHQGPFHRKRPHLFS